MTSFKDITGPLGDQKDNFFDATGFYEVCGAGTYIPFIKRERPPPSLEFLMI